MSQVIHTQFTIVGAGITGLAMAIACQLRGYDYIIIEKSELIKGIGAGIGITSNAIEALRRIGMDEKIKAISNVLSALQILDQKGDIINEGNPSQIAIYDATNYAIHRAALHQCLLNEIDEKKVLTNSFVTDILDYSNQKKVITHNKTTIICDYVIGADGLHSTVRNYVSPNSVLRYAGYTCWRAVINYQLPQHHLSRETWGHSGRFGITPLKNNQVYWYACVNTKQEKDPKFSQYNVDDLLSIFQNYHSIIPDILSQTDPQQLLLHDIYDLKPLFKYYSNNIILMGDAAHATTPNLGQGACMGLEDVATFWEYFDENNGDKTIAEWNEKRVKRCQKLVKTARQIGSIAQWTNPIAISLRNQIFRNSPASFKNKQLEFILDNHKIFNNQA